MTTHRRSRSAARKAKNHSQAKPKKLSVGALQELIKESKVIRISDVALKVKKRLNVDLTLEKLNELFQCDARTLVEAYRTGLGHVCDVRVTPKCNGTLFYHGKNTVQNKENENPNENGVHSGGDSDESFSMMSDAKVDDQESLQDTSEIETIESMSPQPAVEGEKQEEGAEVTPEEPKAEITSNGEAEGVPQQEEEPKETLSNGQMEPAVVENGHIEEVVVPKGEQSEIVVNEETHKDEKEAEIVENGQAEEVVYVSEEKSEISASVEIEKDENEAVVQEVNASVDVTIVESDKTEKTEEVVQEKTEETVDLNATKPQTVETSNEDQEDSPVDAAPEVSEDQQQTADVPKPSEEPEQTNSAESKPDQVIQSEVVEVVKAESSNVEPEAEFKEPQVEESSAQPLEATAGISIDQTSEPSIKESENTTEATTSPQDNNEESQAKPEDVPQPETNGTSEVTTANAVKQPLLEQNGAEGHDIDDEMEKKSQKKGRCCCTIS